MKTLFAGTLLCVCVLSAPSQAQVIYKCVVGGAITYQQSPCQVQAPAKAIDSNTVLVGQWNYDHDTTIAWMKHHATLTKVQEAQLNGMAGHVSFAFTKGDGTVEVTNYDVTHDSGVVHEQGKKETLPYRVMSASSRLVSISEQNPESLGVYTTDFHFEGRDTMWISLANQRLTAVDKPNARIYFRRAR